MQTNAAISLSNHGEFYELTISIPWHAGLTKPFEFLCFSFVSPFTNEEIKGGTLVERQGDWHRILLDAPLSNQSAVQLTVKAKGKLTKATDYPDGVYLESGETRVEVVTGAPVTRNIEPSVWAKSKSAAFIPLCQVHEKSEVVRMPESLTFNGKMWSKAWMQRMMYRMGCLSVFDSESGWAVNSHHEVSLTTAFELTIAPAGVNLLYRTEEGFFQGQAYVLQYLLQLINNQEMYAITLSGGAKFEYRGVHIDVVRHFFDSHTLQEWLDVFALFQYNQFHWHLTDDDGWRVPSDAYPELESIASKRGPGLALPPQMGSGLHQYQGVYSKAEIKQLVHHAAEIGMNVVPEMDLPGHARALLKALPQLQEKHDKSDYQSVQFHSDNVINPAYGDTLNVVNTVLTEWSELFPGNLFHIGSDEIPEGVWQGSPAALDWASKTKQPCENLQGVLLASVENHLASLGKTMAGWEEVVDGGGTSENAWVYSWQGVEAGIAAAKKGHRIVMTPAQHCYLDLAVTREFDDPGYYWAGTVDLAKTYQYNPFNGVPVAYQPKIAGVQMCMWSELIHNKTEAEYMLFPRLLAGAELGFGSNTNGAFDAFYGRVKRWMPLLSMLGLAVRAEEDRW